MTFPKLNTTRFATSLAHLLHETLALETLPTASVNAQLGTLTFKSGNLAAHQSFSLFRQLHAVGKGYATVPESNNLGTVASLDILLTGTLHDGHETARHFASLDLLPNGEIAFIRFGDESSDLRKAG